MSQYRESRIISTAEELLIQRSNIDESRIDANFILRFDPLCEMWLRSIRGMMRHVIDLDGDDMLPDVESFLWQDHLEKSRGLQVFLLAKDGKMQFSGSVGGKGYMCLNQNLILRSQITPNKKLNLEDLDETVNLIGNEARIVSIIQNEINQISTAFGVSPDPNELDNYSQNDIHQINKMIAEWVTREKNIPPFRWKQSQFIERNLSEHNKHIIVYPSDASTNRRIELIEYLNAGAKIITKAGENLTLQGHCLPATNFGRQLLLSTFRDNSYVSPLVINDKGNKRMTLPIRIRTWSIYYLTRRGGGNYTESEAVECWNDNFPKKQAHETNYRDERERLFTRGSFRRIK